MVQRTIGKQNKVGGFNMKLIFKKKNGCLELVVPLNKEHDDIFSAMKEAKELMKKENFAINETITEVKLINE